MGGFDDNSMSGKGKMGDNDGDMGMGNGSPRGAITKKGQGGKGNTVRLLVAGLRRGCMSGCAGKECAYRMCCFALRCVVGVSTAGLSSDSSSGGQAHLTRGLSPNSVSGSGSC